MTARVAGDRVCDTFGVAAAELLAGEVADRRWVNGDMDVEAVHAEQAGCAAGLADRLFRPCRVIDVLAEVEQRGCDTGTRVERARGRHSIIDRSVGDESP